MLDPSGKEFRYFPRQREGKGARGEGKMHGNLVKYQRSSTLEATRAFRSSHLCVESDILRLSRVSTKAIIKMNIYLFSGVNDNLIRNNNKDSRSVELAIIGSRESRVRLAGANEMSQLSVLESLTCPVNLLFERSRKNRSIISFFFYPCKFPSSKKRNA